ncbi:ABC transporter permease [soil metagenome]
MIQNYLTVAWRSLLRNKVYSAINVIGLSIGISACLILFLIVNFELSFDTFHKDRERIYRVYTSNEGENSYINGGVTAPLPLTAKAKVSGLEYAVPLHSFQANVSINSKTGSKTTEFGSQSKIAITDPSYFLLFSSYKWISGAPEYSLNKPHQVVLTRGKANTYFNTTVPTEAIGREINYNDSLVAVVSGIVEELPGNTDFDFEEFVSLATVEKSWLAKRLNYDSWNSLNSSSKFFVKLTDGTNSQDIEKSLSAIHTNNFENHAGIKNIVAYHLQPLNDFHFNSQLGIFRWNQSGAHLQIIKLLGGVAILLLIIASINFINLETAQALRRSREVGIRKVLGSTRTTLIIHFMLQSFVLTLVAIVLSLPLTLFSLDFFKEFIPAGLHFELTNPSIIAFLIFTLVVVSFLAGFYPAFLLSSYLPALALKNQLSASSHQMRAGFVRKLLIVFQFTFAQAFIIAALVVEGQIKFMLDKDLGFTKDAIVYFNVPSRLEQSKTNALKNELEQIAEIKNVTFCESIPSYGGSSSTGFSYNDGKQEYMITAYQVYGDTSFLSVFNMKLLAGRNIHHSDSVKEFIINETFVKNLHLSQPQEAIGKMLRVNRKEYPIVGVVKDFNFKSLYTEVEPVAIADAETDFSYYGIKLSTIDGEDFQTALKKIEAARKKILPENMIETRFLDQTIESFYRTEQRTSKLVNAATIMAIIISCLGLFGLASFTAIQRTKEIGIRKVLGATVKDIVALLSKEFIRLVMIAFVVAAPISYFASIAWLKKFPYRTDVDFSTYAWTIASAFLIVLISVSYQAIKAALADPVESLRYE